MTAHSAADRPDPPGDRLIRDAFTRAGRAGTQCRPIHLLQALSGVNGPIGEALVALRPPDRSGLSAGAGGTFVFGQTQGAAMGFARSRGETMDAPHLLVAVIDQGDVETARVLAAAGLNAADLRVVALQILGASEDLAAIPMPPLTPTGTLDRPALEIADLDPGAWRVLSWRQEHLPLDRVNTRSQLAALKSMERRAAWGIAGRAGVSDDQRYSLISRHDQEVDRRVGLMHPALVNHRSAPHISGLIYDRRLRRRRLPNFLMGWRTWFGNRRRGLRDRWFRLRTRSAFKG